MWFYHYHFPIVPLPDIEVKKGWNMNYKEYELMPLCLSFSLFLFLLFSLLLSHLQ